MLPAATAETVFVTLLVPPVIVSATNVPDTATYVTLVVLAAPTTTIPVAPDVPPVIVSPGVKVPAALVTVRVGRVALDPPAPESYTA